MENELKSMKINNQLKFPSKVYFGNLSSKVLDSRMKTLNLYLNELSILIDPLENFKFQCFLEIDMAIKQSLLELQGTNKENVFSPLYKNLHCLQSKYQIDSKSREILKINHF